MALTPPTPSPLPAVPASGGGEMSGRGRERQEDNAGVRLSEIMAMANRLAGCAQTPPDSQVYIDGEVRRVFFGIGLGLPGPLLAPSPCAVWGIAPPPPRFPAPPRPAPAPREPRRPPPGARAPPATH